ncbi:superoxide dismutase [Cu-Zn] SodC [Larsenimonas suaedae]|uniref:Superoxide dismutase [Cu-Zn] n=1 Tax=Larsenimonas suaedae TaxID=1851019 RepID=A0ABU1GR03_9GAMM|nr:superoxide dismutase [Cu-Zn] SodC [Larsenimonas suaedae]MCM2972745.1 superoxide dismutase [Cu-Zn] SodC [Larsenimonas suaedae]MDR5894458.1 superoxide dismutase [Cu-Zn] SodC [Larsenimonas suaedae]
MLKRTLVAAALSVVAMPMAMADVDVTLNKVNESGTGESVGSVTLKDTQYGLLMTPDIHGLTPGSMHGFHLHQTPSCQPSTKDGEVTPAGAAGGHFDPADTGTHAGPYVEDSHLGDLPVLMAGDEGNATTPVLAPRLKESDLAGHALVIHEGGDTYSEPPKLGGGGARWACGVIDSD